MTKTILESIIREELLAESEQFARGLWEKALQRYANSHDKYNTDQVFNDGILENFIHGDPTRTKKLASWMINQYVKLMSIEEPDDYDYVASKIIESVQKFYELAKEKAITDINIFNYKTLDDLNSAIEKGEENSRAAKIQGALTFLRNKTFGRFSSDSPVVYKTGAYSIVCPTNFEEAEENSEDGNWCVANQENYWNQYVSDSDSTIYFIHIADEEVSKALGLIFEDRIDSTPQSTAHICISVNSRDKLTEVADFYNNHDIQKYFDEYIGLLKIPRTVFEYSDDVDRSGGTLDDYEIQEREDSAFQDHVYEIEKNIKSYAKHYAKFNVNTERLADQIYRYLQDYYPEWIDVEYSWDGNGPDDYPSAYSEIEGDMNSMGDDEEAWDRVIDRIQEAMYYQHTLDPDIAVEWEQNHPDKPRRPYLDADKYTQQELELQESIYRRTLKLLQERKVIFRKRSFS